MQEPAAGDQTRDSGPRYSKYDLVEVEPGQGVLLFGGDQDDPMIVMSEQANKKTQEDCALALWALHNPEIRAMFKAALGRG